MELKYQWWNDRAIFVDNEKDMLAFDIFYWELREEMEKSGFFKGESKDSYLNDIAIHDETFIREVKDSLKSGKEISIKFF